MENSNVFYACPYCLPCSDATLILVKSEEKVCNHEESFFGEIHFSKNKECKKKNYKCKEVLKCRKCKEIFAFTERFLKEQKRKYKDG